MEQVLLNSLEFPKFTKEQFQQYFPTTCATVMNCWYNIVYVLKDKNQSIVNTVNRVRFAGLNFCGFRDFEDDCESFSVNILRKL